MYTLSMLRCNAKNPLSIYSSMSAMEIERYQLIKLKTNVKTSKLIDWRMDRITSIANLINIIQVDSFGAKVIVSCSNGVVELPIASIVLENHRKITILLVGLEKFLQILFGVERMDS